VALSHQAGLVGLPGGFTVDELAAHTPIAERLAAMGPLWRPGTAHGYHGITIGTIVAELVQRISGTSFHDFYAQRIRRPAGIDHHFGIGEHDDAVADRIVRVEPPVVPPEIDAASLQPRPDSLLALAMNSVRGFPGLVEIGNHPRNRAAGPPAMGAVASARGLAELYAVLLESAPAGPLMSTTTIATMSQTQVAGLDLVLEIHDRFGIVFQTPDSRLTYGSPWAFGHDGAGGSIGFADPAHDLAFGYVTYRTPVPAGADVRGLALAAATRGMPCFALTKPRSRQVKMAQ
jgi:CubicO group peptidase (beta-lactamase class C family)